MADAETQPVAPSMTMGKALGFYAGAMGVFIILVALTIRVDAFPGQISLGVYLASGYLLNRTVLRGLIEWHPVYNTVDNVATAKLWMLLLWPGTYPLLFFKLLVARHL